VAEQLPVLVLVRDLLFQSRITAEAKAAGVSYEILRDPKMLAQKSGRLVLADLNQEGVIAAVQAWIAATGAQAVGFVSHVDAEKIAEARAAGIQSVLARSTFVAQLPQLLRAI
jgi:hypothetical protein